MANTISSFYQTLVAAAAEASSSLVGTTALMDNVYLDYKPVETSPGQGQTLNIAIPVSPTVADGGVAAPTITDITFNTKPVVFDQHPIFTYKVADFEQFNSPADIRTVFLDSALKAMLEYINGLVAAKIVTGTFTTNATVVATGVVTTGHTYPLPVDLLKGMANLAGQKCPMNDLENLAFINDPIVHYRMLGDNAWIQQSIASERVASEVRETGSIRRAFGFALNLDQQSKSTGSAGSRTFNGFAFHKYCIAVVTRPLPKPDGKVVSFTYMPLKGVPVRIQFGYSIAHNGYIVTVDAGLGVGVIRPELGQIITSLE